MSFPLKTSSYLAIVNRARARVLTGGGVTSDENGDHEAAISTLANQHFGARSAQIELEAALSELPLEIRQQIMDAVWTFVTANQDAGFTFGAAVGLQLRQVVAVESKEGSQA